MTQLERQLEQLVKEVLRQTPRLGVQLRAVVRQAMEEAREQGRRGALLEAFEAGDAALERGGTTSGSPRADGTIRTC